MLITLAIFLSTLPFLWLFSQFKIMGDFTAAFANIAGLLGVVLMLWQLILGNRFISKKFSLDRVALVKLHIFLGTYGLFFILAHPFLEMIAYGQKISFLFLPNLSSEFEEHITFGRLAIYLYFLLFVSSAMIRNKIPYRAWRFLHYLSFPTLFLVFIHAAEIGTFLNTFILLKVYFYILMAVFAFLVLYRLSQLLDVGKFPYVLLRKKKNKGDIVTYTFRPLAIKLIPQAGQFFFIKPSVFAESHPFTVMNFNEKTGELTFAIKTVGKFTSHLEKIEAGQTVFLDGPYGVFTKEGQNNQDKVIVAGGIGITPFVELIARFGQENTKLFYANRYSKDVMLREEFKKQLGENYVELVSRGELEDASAIQGRLDEQIFSQHLSKKLITQANFFICGGKSFMDSVIMSLQKLGVDKKRIFVEEFSL